MTLKNVAESRANKLESPGHIKHSTIAVIKKMIFFVMQGHLSVQHSTNICEAVSHSVQARKRVTTTTKKMNRNKTIKRL